jgi:hypothetical protein
MLHLLTAGVREPAVGLRGVHRQGGNLNQLLQSLGQPAAAAAAAAVVTSQQQQAAR